MGSPLIVALAEIRLSYLEEEALRTCPESPIHYYHFVDDGFGHFRSKIQADKFLEHLNSLSPDLDYTIEYPHPDGSIPFFGRSDSYRLLNISIQETHQHQPVYPLLLSIYHGFKGVSRAFFNEKSC